MLDIYRMRPVETDRLPYTPEQRAAGKFSLRLAIYADDHEHQHEKLTLSASWPSLTSVWMDQDESKMFPEARTLFQRGFPAQKVAEHVLQTYLRFRFFNPQVNDDTAHAITMRPNLVQQNGPAGPYCEIRISLAAQ